MTALAIKTTRLTKRFGSRTVVDGLDLEVPLGSVYGFLGPNGSGKTTTVRMLMGLAKATAGDIEVLGQPMPAAASGVLPRIGAMIEGPAFYPYLTGRQNLQRYDEVASGKRHSAAQIDKALEVVGLSSAAKRRYRSYSLGMRQRLSLANALMFRRELLILDEPTNGLDPQGTREVRNTINQLNQDGVTVFLSSHLLTEIDQMCSHAAIISSGKPVAQGTLEMLRGSTGARVQVTTPDVESARLVITRDLHLPSITVTEDGVSAEANGALPEHIVKALVDGGVRVRGFVEVRPSLEDAFVALTGEGFDVAE